MSRQERRDKKLIFSSKDKYSIRKERSSGLFRIGKANNRARFTMLRLVLLMFLIIFAMGATLIFSALQGNLSDLGKPLPSSSASATPTAKATSTPSVSPKPSPSRTAQYNQVDALAIMGAFALARQVPASAGKEMNDFIANLAKIKADPSSHILDLGVMGMSLTDYRLSPDGFASPVCFAVHTPLVSGESPKAQIWVIYIEPTSKTKKALVLLSLGVRNCQDAVVAASEMPNDTRATISTISKHVIQEAILTIPTSFLTHEGLLLLDEARGTIK